MAKKKVMREAIKTLDALSSVIEKIQDPSAQNAIRTIDETLLKLLRGDA